MTTMAEGQEQVTGGLELKLGDTVKDLVTFALGVAALAAVLGAALYYTWNWALAETPLSFTEPIGNYGTAVIVVIGAYVAFMVWQSAREMSVADVFSYKNVLDIDVKIDNAIELVSRPAVLLLLAYLAHQFLV